MRIIAGKTQLELERESAVAVGKFDGIHRGHRRLLEEILRAKRQGLAAVVFTFDPPAASFFAGRTLRELTTRSERRRQFERLGIDVLVEFPLNRETAAIPPEPFVRETLSRGLHARLVAAGEDVSFGARGAGDAALLHALAAECGYTVRLIEKIRENGREISSTWLREEIGQGHMEQAARLLGEPYTLTGTVVHGAHLGRTLGMPTLNLTPEPEKLLPPNGVYYSHVLLAGKRYDGVTNIGCKPTVSNSRAMGAETCLLDFSGDAYGEEIEVGLLHYTRPEMRFADVDALGRQMRKDLEGGRRFFQGGRG